MKKALLIALAALFLMQRAVPARAAQGLKDMMVFEEEGMDSAVMEVLLLEDGMLLAGGTEYWDGGWLARTGPDGGVRWILPEEESGIFTCLARRAGGGFSAMTKPDYRPDENGKWAYAGSPALVFVSEDGVITSKVPLAEGTEWLLAGAGGYYTVGSMPAAAPPEDSEVPPTRPVLTRLNGAGKTVWSSTYAFPGYLSAAFNRAVPAGDEVIIAGEGYITGPFANIGLVGRMGTDGHILWTREFSLGDDSRINDVHVTGDGKIVVICSSMTYDEEEGYRSCSVFCLDGNGGTLWEYALEEGWMLDYILPAEGGFLLGSRGLDLENCPSIGDGWLLLLDREGRVKAAGSTPDIGGGRYEFYGMVNNADGKALLFGSTLTEPGFPGWPFIARLDFPEAYQ